MYEKKNELSQPVPILSGIIVRLLDALYRNNINEKTLFWWVSCKI